MEPMRRARALSRDPSSRGCGDHDGAQSLAPLTVAGLLLALLVPAAPRGGNGRVDPTRIERHGQRGHRAPARRAQRAGFRRPRGRFPPTPTAPNPSRSSRSSPTSRRSSRFSPTVRRRRRAVGHRSRHAQDRHAPRARRSGGNTLGGGAVDPRARALRASFLEIALGASRAEPPDAPPPPRRRSRSTHDRQGARQPVAARRLEVAAACSAACRVLGPPSHGMRGEHSWRDMIEGHVTLAGLDRAARRERIRHGGVAQASVWRRSGSSCVPAIVRPFFAGAGACMSPPRRNRRPTARRQRRALDTIADAARVRIALRGASSWPLSFTRRWRATVPRSSSVTRSRAQDADHDRKSHAGGLAVKRPPDLWFVRPRGVAASIAAAAAAVARPERSMPSS